MTSPFTQKPEARAGAGSRWPSMSRGPCLLSANRSPVAAHLLGMPMLCFLTLLLTHVKKLLNHGSQDSTVEGVAIPFL